MGWLERSLENRISGEARSGLVSDRLKIDKIAIALPLLSYCFSNK
ncbi:hypothetical protein [Chroococcidiopsis sp. SAG 2025]|nr:hypothetical protein [Chroococcidiopsis sp. SAG 2025]